jgi:hypothetical protein
MTCSILRAENEGVSGVAGLTILPNKNGWDGGYGAEVA